MNAAAAVLRHSSDASRSSSPALIIGDRSLTYGELSGRMRGAARVLRGLGVGKGDRVVLSASSTEPAYVFGYLACHFLGAVPVPIYSKLVGSSVWKIVEQIEPRCVFLAEPTAGGQALALRTLETSDSSLDRVETVATDTAQIIFTTGTTGSPKGVELSYANLGAFQSLRASVVGFDEMPRELIPAPLNHVFGLGRLLFAWSAGGTAIVVDGFQSPARIFRAFEEYRPTSLSCVPAGLAMMLELAGDRLGDFLGGLRFIETASAPLPAAQRERLAELLPETRLYMAYGLTEAAGSIVYTDFSDPGRRHSIGRPRGDIEAKIDRSGQLMFRGPSVMKGYWRNQEESSRVLVDGWLLTNDVARIDDDGFVFLIGRLEELMNVGGLKVAPVEIEEALREHPSVGDCACIGHADRGWIGEKIVAFVVQRQGRAAPSRDELVRFLRSRLEPHKMPSEFEWVEQLPRTASGKLQRIALKERSLA